MFLLIYNMVRFFCFIAFCSCCICALSQNTVKVKGSYNYKIGENEYFSIAEAKKKAVEKAKIEALKATFGEFFRTDVVDVRTETNDKSTGLFYESTMASVKGIWVKDSKNPVIHLSVNDNGLVVKAEVEGLAAEKKAPVNIKWTLMGETSGTIDRTNQMLRPNEDFFIQFKSPVDGYIAVYLKDMNTNEISCLLPYRNSINGQFHIFGSKLYQLFDERYDPMAENYHFTQSKKGTTEFYKVILVFSQKPFTKCVDLKGDFKHANSLTEEDLNSWINNLIVADNDAVVDELVIVVKG